MKYSFVRFIIVGIVNTVVGLSVMYLLLHLLGQSYWIATFVGNSIGAFVSFILNRNFTFKSKDSVSKSAIRFIVVILGCYFISYEIGRSFVEWILNKNEFFSPFFKTDISVLIGTCLYTLLNYFGQKLFVFSKKDTVIFSTDSK
ncbi:Putative flippase GtrA (transmembrane translocase of bactoprenol-linked glucose) [Bacillus sp. OV166]|uniref:GtrA family protein n=1 Tax=Bacillus sp. OV166 TaxID=1882763 RepID=UPI000A2AB5E4|nr:GtrA family protein [Bacillus sp. OV166]SMQ77444.1 Putative flippase GtrA (transmembrane translocase of bactoprenol-linked glucose) [Bacillus sp. OV166]